MIKSLCFLIFSYSLYCLTYAQERSVVLIIDTIIAHNQSIPLHMLEVEICDQDRKTPFFCQNFDSTAHLDLYSYPNYINTLFLQTDTSKIKLPIDDEGSFVLLQAPENLDTIHINQLNLYNTKPPNTTYMVISKYKKINGELSDNQKPYRIKKRRKIAKTTTPPEVIIFNINGLDYSCHLQLKKQDGFSIMHGHGYRPRKYLDKNGVYKRKVTYFHVNERTIQFYWIGGVIKIKP